MQSTTYKRLENENLHGQVYDKNNIPKLSFRNILIKLKSFQTNQ